MSYKRTKKIREQIKNSLLEKWKNPLFREYMTNIEKHPKWNKNKKKCLGCGVTPKNKSANRCMPCFLKFKKENAKGRIIGIFCKICGKELTIKKNKSGKCFKCFHNTRIPWNKGTQGIVRAWNKGKSRFKNKQEYRVHSNKLRRKTRKEDKNGMMSDRIRTLIRNQMKRYSKNGKLSKTTDLLGCSIISFREHLKSRFLPGMSWENYGNGQNKWNIDHIKPVSKFNLDDFQEQQAAFNYNNCQPMWSIENMKKGNRI